MIRFLISLVVFFGAAVVGLAVANAVLEGMTVDTGSFLLAAAIFAILQAVLAPFFMVNIRRFAPAALSGVGLVTTFAALLLTVLISDGISIDGITTWILATLIVWLATLLASLILPLLVARWIVTESRERRAEKG
jgi:uncharacterized membrane protein YvlD (DUF360 family)